MKRRNISIHRNSVPGAPKLSSRTLFGFAKVRVSWLGPFVVITTTFPKGS